MRGLPMRFVGCALLFLLAAGCARVPAAPAPPAPAAPPAGEPAAPAQGNPDEIRPLPGFQAPEVMGRDIATDKLVVLSSLRGKVVMINFWATWCGPCRVEMPAMEQFHKTAGDWVKVLAVGADGRESIEQLQGFVRELNLTFTVLHDHGASMRAYHVLGIPTTVFVDQKGIVRSRHTGILTLEKMQQLAAEARRLGEQ